MVLFKVLYFSSIRELLNNIPEENYDFAKEEIVVKDLIDHIKRKHGGKEGFV